MKVSIIIPVYNVALYIEQCLNSVLQQSYSDLEIILVNDCTPDESIELATKIITKHSRRDQVMIINHESNKGLSAARNTGVLNSTGEWIFFLDSDDEIEFNCIQKFVDLVNLYPNIDAAVCGFKIIGSSDKFPIYSNEFLDTTSKIVSEYLYFKWPVMACNKLIRKSFFISHKLWFVEGLLHEDELFSFKLACRSKQIAISKAETYVYKIRESGSITSDKSFRNYQSMIIINEYRFSQILTMINQGFDLKGGMHFIISSTLLFLRSLRNNTSLTSIESKKLAKNTYNLFIEKLLLRKIDSVKDLIKVLYIYILYFLETKCS